MADRHHELSRRERQIMDILYRRGRATAGEVMGELQGNPSYSTVRTQLRVLEEKGHVRHEEDGLRYVYARPPRAARPASLRCGIWWTPSSTAPRNRRSPPSWVAKARGCRRKSSTALRSW